MKKAICSFIYYKLLGWKTNFTQPIYDKCVICVAPHTSNWDLLMGKILWGSLGLTSHFLMKKDWFFFPLGILFRSMGGIPVDRDKNTSLVDQMLHKIGEMDVIRLAVTPEGTRKPNSVWKKGFYYIALGAKVPIALIGLDYKTKTVFYNQVIIPTGNYDEDLIKIKNYFKNFEGKKPENFKL